MLIQTTLKGLTQGPKMSEVNKQRGVQPLIPRFDKLVEANTEIVPATALVADDLTNRPEGPGLLPNPNLFAHGRLLYRFKGSDAFRFSPQVACNMLTHLPIGDGPQILWDPFCGTGLIPSVGLFGHAGKFDAVIASDIKPEAARCARANMRLFSEPHGLDERLREVQRRQKVNAKATRRWSAVARYIEHIQPLLEAQREQLPPIYAFASSVFALPLLEVQGRIHFVADLPYGTMCQLQGGTLEEVVPSILRVYPTSNITFVVQKGAVKKIRVDRPYK